MKQIDHWVMSKSRLRNKLNKTKINLSLEIKLSCKFIKNKYKNLKKISHLKKLLLIKLFRNKCNQMFFQWTLNFKINNISDKYACNFNKPFDDVVK